METLIKYITRLTLQCEKSGCKGISGFLYLPAGSLLTILFLLIAFVVINVQTLYSSVFHEIIADYPGLRASMISQTMIFVMQVVFAIHVTLLFFRKKQELPKMIIAFMTMHLLVMIGNISWIASVYNDLCFSEYGGVLAAVFMAVAGIPYFMRSRRVKATFVNP